MRLGKGIVLVLSFLVATAGFSQVNFGIKAGLNTGDLAIDFNSVENTIANNTIKGFEMGTFLNIELGNAYMRPEALYSFQQGVTLSEFGSPSFAHRFELPVIAGVKFLKVFALEAGPTFHYTAYAQERLSGDFTVQSKGIGYRIGPSLHLGKIMAYANFQGFIMNFGDSPSINEPYRVNIGVGYRFGKK